MGDFDDLKRKRLIQKEDEWRRGAQKEAEEVRKCEKESAAYEKHEGLVREALEDLRKTLYPDSVNKGWSLEQLKGYYENSFPIYKTVIDVSLKFGNYDDPVRFVCSAPHSGETEARLSRDGLVKAIKKVLR